MKALKKRGRKRSFLENEYKNSWNYIKDSRNFVYVIALIFFIFALGGFFITPAGDFAEQILKFIQELIEKIQGMSQGELISFIFFNNLQSSFFGMILGVLLGIFPVVIIIANGYLLGFVASMSVNSEGILVLWRVLPHGVFELPAVFISLGLGLKLGFWLILEPVKFYWKKNKLISASFLFFYLPALLITLCSNKQFRLRMKKSLEVFPANLWDSLKAFLFIIIPLLIIAAIIEGSLMFIFR